MPRERLRRYSFRRGSRPRNWSPYLLTGAAVASHAPHKSGGNPSVRAIIDEMRLKEASTLTVNEEVECHD